MAINPPAKTAPDVKSLSGTAKVAVLLLAMGRELSGTVLKQFDPDEIKIVTRAASELTPISTPELESIIEEFAQNFTAGPNISATVGELEQLLAGVLPAEQISDLMSEVSGNKTKSVWERISFVSESLLANYLLKEHPQTAALILSRVKPACAARVMSHLPGDIRHGLMRRMLSLKPVVEDAMSIIEKTMHEDFMINFERNLAADTYPRMADIINKMERAQMEESLKSLAESRPKSAEILKGMLFTFDDIVNLTPKARMLIFDQVPTDRVVTALKGADATFRELILSSLASRTRRLVDHELANGVPANHREIVEARRVITDLALEMAGRGEIDLNPDEEDQPLFT
ncbi:flagellar motor switch protein FliG [Rhodopseudomonas sp. NSM]|uniref:flagellar motor switch protein FliG n=1 Tax=Rhodopseudomonas sp. NSM TaxID=3457630 RepID=UPI004035A636